MLTLLFLINILLKNRRTVKWQQECMLGLILRGTCQQIRIKIYIGVTFIKVGLHTAYLLPHKSDTARHLMFSNFLNLKACVLPTILND